MPWNRVLGGSMLFVCFFLISTSLFLSFPNDGWFQHLDNITFLLAFEKLVDLSDFLRNKKIFYILELKRKKTRKEGKEQKNFDTERLF